MHTRKDGLAIAACALSAALLLAACTSGSKSTGATNPSSGGGNLVIGRASDIQTLNKTNAFGNSSLYTIEQIMQPLFTASANGKTVEPLLAKGYSLSKDKMTYTITLRPDVKFSNGKAVTAADVKFSIDENSKTGTTNGGWGFINSAIKTISVVNNETVKIQLKYPWAPLLADLSLFANGIIPNNYGGKTESSFYKDPTGTGPFVYDTWKPGQYLKVVRNKNYWVKGQPHANSVTWTVVPDANTRELQLQGGQIDIDVAPDWSSLKSINSTPGLTAKTFPSTELSYMIFNQQKAPFSDVHVRRAISYAIDRKSIINAVLFGNGTPANSLFAPGLPYYDSSAPAPSYNLAKAKAELAMSKVPGGFTTSVLVRSGTSDYATAQVIQAELKKININLQIRQLDSTTVTQLLAKSQFQTALTQWTSDIPDPDEFMTFAVDPKGGNNSAYSYYNNPQVTELAAEAQRQTNPSKRASLYDQLQKLTGQDTFLAYLYYAPYPYAWRSSVSGFSATPMGNYDLGRVSKK